MRRPRWAMPAASAANAFPASKSADIQLGGGMSGVELAQYAKRQFPDLNVVMVSGHGPPYVPRDTHFLMKPYDSKGTFLSLTRPTCMDRDREKLALEEKLEVRGARQGISEWTDAEMIRDMEEEIRQQIHSLKNAEV